MRILYYSSHPDLNFQAATGYGRHMREMVDAFRRLGHEVHLLIGGGHELRPVKPIPAAKQNRAKSMIHPLAWQTARDMALLRFDRRMGAKLAAEIEAFQPDIVYERVGYLQASGIRVAKLKGIFHFAEINAPFPEERQAFSGKSLLIGRSRKVEREILKHSQAISFVSQALADYAKRIAPEAAEKFIVIPNAVHPQDAPENPARDAIRKRLGLAEKKVVGFVGSIFPYHGVDLLVGALAAISDQADVHGLIVGDGATLPQLRDMAANLGLSDRITFTGSVPHREVYDYISAMDLCCMNKSNWYGSPVKIFEYGLMKKAILAPRVAPVTEVMSDKDALFCEANVASVTEKLLEMLADEKARNAMAAHWHHRVLIEYTWDRAAEKIIQVCT